MVMALEKENHDEGESKDRPNATENMKKTGKRKVIKRTFLY